MTEEAKEKVLLAVMAVTAGQDALRPTLTGVCREVHPGVTRYVSTTGRVLAQVEVSNACAEAQEPVTLDKFGRVRPDWIYPRYASVLPHDSFFCANLEFARLQGTLKGRVTKKGLINTKAFSAGQQFVLKSEKGTVRIDPVAVRMAMTQLDMLAALDVPPAGTVQLYYANGGSCNLCFFAFSEQVQWRFICVALFDAPQEGDYDLFTGEVYEID